jgi:hypothetical protein
MHSPDRRYWWDGSNWSLAVTADGRLWFDGQNWVLNPLRPPVRRRAPTKWTVPLQWLVIVVAVLSFGLLVAAGPLLISMLTIPVVEPPSGLPPGISPGQLEQAAREARQSFIGVIVVEGLIALALLVLVVVGALRRWRWAFWLTVVLNAFNALNITAVPVLRHPPVALQVAGTIMDVIQAMTCVALLVAAIRIGPWACRREVAEETSSGQ